MLKMILAVHVLGGATALLSMGIPLVAKKGGRAHVRAGWIFVAGMTIVSLTAFVLSAARFLFDPRPEAKAGGVFLFYIAILTAAGVSAGMRAVRARRRTGGAHPWDVGMAALLTLTALGVAAFGIVTRVPLFVLFSLLGLANGIGQLRYWLRPRTSRMHWWYEHMAGMLGACIAAVTAFLVNNAGRLGLPNTSLLVWLAPGVIGGIATAIWTAYYRRKFDGARPPRQVRLTWSPAAAAPGVPARRQ